MICVCKWSSSADCWAHLIFHLFNPSLDLVGSLVFFFFSVPTMVHRVVTTLMLVSLSFWLQFLEPFLQFLDFVLNVFAFWIVSFVGSDSLSTTFEGFHDHVNELMIIVERHKILLDVKVRVFVEVLFQLTDPTVIWFPLWKQLVNSLKLVILAVNLGAATALHWPDIEGSDIARNMAVRVATLHHSFLVNIPYFSVVVLTQLSHDWFYVICSWFFWFDLFSCLLLRSQI